MSLTRRKVLWSPSKDGEEEEGGEENQQESGEPRPHQPRTPSEHAGHICINISTIEKSSAKYSILYTSK